MFDRNRPHGDWLAASIAALTFLSCGRAGAAPVPDEPRPAGLSAADRADVRAAYDAGRHAVVAVAGGHRAQNPGQGWTTSFDGEGFTVDPDGAGWTWGLALERFGFAGDERALDGKPSVRVDGTRVTYAWDSTLEEWASNPDFDDNFGFSVSIDGDIAVVGAPHEASSATGVNGDGSNNDSWDSGAVYVFVRAGGSWSPPVYLKASNTGSTDEFGWSVSISGDTIVVGAWDEESAAKGVNGDQSDDTWSGAGAAYVFVQNGGIWSQQAYLKAFEPGDSGYFGSGVSIWGDLIVVGAEGEWGNATGVNGVPTGASPSSGAAYVFLRSGSTWYTQAYLKASNTGSGDAFGNAVSIRDATVIVGAYLESSSATGVNGNGSDNGAWRSGAAYVYTVPCGAITKYGSGCAGSGGYVPTLGAVGCAAGNGTITLRIANALGGAPVLLFVGNQAIAQPAGGGCTLLVPPLLTIPITGALVFGSGPGSGKLVLDVTLGPMAPDVTVFLQTAIADPGSPLGLTLTNGLEVDID